MRGEEIEMERVREKRRMIRGNEEETGEGGGRVGKRVKDDKKWKRGGDSRGEGERVGEKGRRE